MQPANLPANNLSDHLKDLALTGKVQSEVMFWIKEKISSNNQQAAAAEIENKLQKLADLNS